uniref:Adaptor protein ClpS core domain-containing protein n=1 Tax=Chromera velia CCMP2878 TaxID=1169474 RepID=A0A0G4IDR6_9ALVE|mmetsp:Transcript_32261/g.64039  ORF Transcript_32261/g.64039 Transcript_32261/m.64039 type:complete len:203 (+) Transcript_32261:128-736(+)|eukprot:Cvel_2349.t1-p1 / transcript=Cvel_2349.t1 / gene=Cvel_2349 / organism=Chromera_velia_CCMP2878 / gene_product=ATP-dependent Clp protease adapter protein ClpS, putative / transcript_product=ATP-dependent Clp protease adapter protein ClpS, putative / location=Cvel_scaffold91:28809-30741(+) / protein_length=202 / sequence_SO=supercontig / SO=protein_coding / is_pseudo=false
MIWLALSWCLCSFLVHHGAAFSPIKVQRLRHRLPSRRDPNPRLQTGGGLLETAETGGVLSTTTGFFTCLMAEGGEARQKVVRKIKKSMKKKKVKQADVTDEEKEKRKKLANAWKVVLHNDDIHTFKYVIDSIVECVPIVTPPAAHQITVSAHNGGFSTVCTSWRPKAEEFCLELQKKGLTVSVSPNKPEGKDGGGDSGGKKD